MAGGRLPILAALAIGALAASGAAAEDKPERIVSTNVCTDQLVLRLAERSRIVSLSALATDPRSSALSREARGIPANHGLAEEVMTLRPDIVVASAFATRTTNVLLRRLGYRVVEVPVAEDLDGVRANLVRVAEALGEGAKGRGLAALFAARVQAVRSAEPAMPPLAALYWANGYTSGAGTLANDVIETAGFRTLARLLRVRGTGTLPMETLLAARPDVLILGGAQTEPALAGEVLAHPALARGLAGRGRISVPDNLWLCGTPMVADALERLARLRAALRSDG